MFKIIGKIYTKENSIEREEYLKYSKKGVVYEVIRSVNKKLLFYSDHIERLNNSLNKVYSYKLNEKLILEIIDKCINENNIENANIRIDIIKLINRLEIFVYQIEAIYPNKYQYSNGVNTVFQFAVRENPSIKMANPKLKSESHDLIHSENVYETILVNTKGELTEGSRSNIFFIKNRTIYSPLESMILKGITRKYLLKLIREMRIEFIEYRITKENISYFDAAFLSGTSPIILPIRTIQNFNFNINNKLLRKLMHEFIPFVLKS